MLSRDIVGNDIHWHLYVLGMVVDDIVIVRNYMTYTAIVEVRQMITPYMLDHVLMRSDLLRQQANN